MTPINADIKIPNINNEGVSTFIISILFEVSLYHIGRKAINSLDNTCTLYVPGMRNCIKSYFIRGHGNSKARRYALIAAKRA
jgi:hypothetical protein